MKPKPFEELKNFTVPMVMIVPLSHRVPLTRMRERPWKQEHRVGWEVFFGASVRPSRAGRIDGKRFVRQGRKNHERCV